MFKQTEVWLQAAVIIFCIIALTTGDIELYESYFIVGGFQLAGILIHELAGSFTTKGTARRVYHNITYVLVVYMALSPLTYITVIVFLPLLFIAPFMACYYLVMCYRETYLYMRRPLSILK